MNNEETDNNELAEEFQELLKESIQECADTLKWSGPLPKREEWTQALIGFRAYAAKHRSY